MKRAVIFWAMIIGAVPLCAQDITGTWSGEADLGLQKFPLVFNIEKSGDGYSATMDSPLQGAKGIPASSVTFGRDTLRISMSQIAFTYTGVLNGCTLKGSFTQRGSTFTLDLERSGITVNRPQEPKPPFPYRSEEVVFENRDANIRLAGTLTMPAEGTNFPAVVLLTGSGTQNRDEELFGHKPFLVLADHFARNGIATLRFDDRGTGQSGGDPATATTAGFATDAAAALDYLHGRREIDSRKTGLAGHSEGGMTAFMAAADRPSEVAFVVSMAGPGVRGDSISIMQIEDIMLQRGTPADQVKVLAARQRESLEMIYGNTSEYVDGNIEGIARRMVAGYDFLDEAAKNNASTQIRASNLPWARFFMSHDPADYIERVKCPVLVINGGKDLQVRASVNTEAIRTVLERGGNNRSTVIVYPGLNHMFQTSGTGRIEEYGRLEETFSPQTMEDITVWILKVTE